MTFIHVDLRSGLDGELVDFCFVWVVRGLVLILIIFNNFISLYVIGGPGGLGHFFNPLCPMGDFRHHIIVNFLPIYK